MRSFAAACAICDRFFCCQAPNERESSDSFSSLPSSSSIAGPPTRSATCTRAAPLSCVVWTTTASTFFRSSLTISFAAALAASLAAFLAARRARRCCAATVLIKSESSESSSSSSCSPSSERPDRRFFLRSSRASRSARSSSARRSAVASRSFFSFAARRSPAACVDCLLSVSLTTFFVSAVAISSSVSRAAKAAPAPVPLLRRDFLDVAVSTTNGAESRGTRSLPPSTMRRRRCSNIFGSRPSDAINSRAIVRTLRESAGRSATEDSVPKGACIRGPSSLMSTPASARAAAFFASARQSSIARRWDRASMRSNARNSTVRFLAGSTLLMGSELTRLIE
eukprot:Opistho-2@92410